MIFLGLILVALSGAFALGVALSNTSTTQAEAFGVTLSNVTLGGLFVAGLVTGAVLMLGLAMMLAGGARKSRRRRARKAEVKDVRNERADLADENVRLHEELNAERRDAVAPVTSNPSPAAQTGERGRSAASDRRSTTGNTTAVREDVDAKPSKTSRFRR